MGRFFTRSPRFAQISARFVVDFEMFGAPAQVRALM
jgi:hypothetical protein